MTDETRDTVHIDDDDVQLMEAAVALKDAAVELGGHARVAARAARRELMQVADTHPYALAGSAAGVGFVVAGGLTAPATKALVSMGLKLGSAFVIDAAIATLRGPLKPAPTPAATKGNGDSTRDRQPAGAQMSPTNRREE